jgi:hypothetical protein
VTGFSSKVVLIYWEINATLIELLSLLFSCNEVLIHRKFSSKTWVALVSCMNFVSQKFSWQGVTTTTGNTDKSSLDTETNWSE